MTTTQKTVLIARINDRTKAAVALRECGRAAYERGDSRESLPAMLAAWRKKEWLCGWLEGQRRAAR